MSQPKATIPFSQFNKSSECSATRLSRFMLIGLGVMLSFAGGCQLADSSLSPAMPDFQAQAIASSPAKPKYVRPKTADNGVPFPTQASYIKNYPVRFTDGYSSVTVDNSKNNSDVFVKLFSLDSRPEQPIRVFFIPAYKSFTAEKIRPGRYDVRYRDLSTGALFRTDKFDLQETQIGSGIQFSRLRLTLYKVAGGNMQTHGISEQEF
jgi:hypothetical protein